jgi:hypothetical protein
MFKANHLVNELLYIISYMKNVDPGFVRTHPLKFTIFIAENV